MADKACEVEVAIQTAERGQGTERKLPFDYRYSRRHNLDDSCILSELIDDIYLASIPF